MMHAIRLVFFFFCSIQATNLPAQSLASLNSDCRQKLSQAAVAQAQEPCKKAYLHSQTHLTEPASEIAQATDNQAELALTLGQYLDAIALYQRAVGLQTSAAPALQALALENLGNAYLRAQQNAEAEVPLREALSLRERSAGQDSREAADSLHALGLWALAINRLSEANDFFRRALVIRQAKGLAQDPLIGRTWFNIAIVTLARQGASAAEPIFQQALAIQQQHPNELSQADTLDQLARIAANSGQAAQAETYWTRGLRLREQLLGAKHPALTANLNDLGMLYLQSGLPAPAEQHMRRALDISTAVYGSNDLRVADIANNLGVLLVQTQRAKDAINYLQHAAAITHVALGPQHATTQGRWGNLQRALSMLTPAAQRP